MSLERFYDLLESLDESDYRLLKAMYRNITKYESIPVEVLANDMKVSVNYVLKRIAKLHSLKLVWTRARETRSYMLNFLGLDILTLRKLFKKGIISGIGKPIGIGKEADVFEALSPEDVYLAIKFYRIGRASFTKYTRTRAIKSHSNLVSSIKAARLEYEAIQKLFRAGVKVPKPVYSESHAVVLDMFRGIELSIVNKLKDPERILSSIIENAYKAYIAGIVHGDLSPYNVLVTEEEDTMIIDWPQWVPSNHPQAISLLQRDFYNILKFFKRKWKVKSIPESCKEMLSRMVPLDKFKEVIQL